MEGGYEVHATCGGCWKSKQLDLKALAVAHGETAVLYHLAQRFRCACGHRGARLSIIPVNAPGFALGYSQRR